MTLGRLPQFSQLTKFTMKPIVIDALESPSWVPYTDDGKHTKLLCSPPLTNTGAPLLRSNYTQPSNIGSVCKTYSELSEIVHKSLYLMHTPGSISTGQNLLEIHNQYLQWYDFVPAALLLGQKFKLCVLFC